MTTVLSVSQVGAAYGSRRVLTDLDLVVDRGEMVAILGPSGCGKTTLLRSVAGLHRIDRGSIELGGAVVERAGGVHVGPERRRISLMPQEGGLFPHLSVRRNIEFGLHNRDLRDRYGSRARRRQRAQELAELVGLPDALDARPNELSGGQQQRIALARALAPEPALVLMDEPFAALDAGLRASIRSDVRELLQRSGTSSILVTHDQQEALGTADRVAVLLDGSCVQTDSPDDIYRRPASKAVAAFVGDADFVDAFPTSDSTVDTIFGSLAVTGSAHGVDSVMVRPEDLVVTAADDGDFTASDVQFTGPLTSITLVHDATGVVVRTITLDRRGIVLGIRARVSVRQPVTAFHPQQVRLPRQQLRNAVDDARI